MPDETKKEEETAEETFNWFSRRLDARTDAIKIAVEIHSHREVLSLDEILKDAERIFLFLIEEEGT